MKFIEKWNFCGQYIHEIGEFFHSFIDDWANMKNLLKAYVMATNHFFPKIDADLWTWMEFDTIWIKQWLSLEREKITEIQQLFKAEQLKNIRKWMNKFLERYGYYA